MICLLREAKYFMVRFVSFNAKILVQLFLCFDFDIQKILKL